MDNRIVITADTEEALNKLIDGKLKEKYLISGGIYLGEQEELSQVMVIPNNIDEEFTLAGGVKMVIMLCVMYFILKYSTP